MEEQTDNSKAIKEDILRALEGKKIMLCPHCKNKVFIRNELSKVEITEDEDGLLDNMVGGWGDYKYSCAKCHEDVDVDKMISTTKLVFNQD